jgi:hypothetical protein
MGARTEPVITAAMTPAQLNALPATVRLETANQALNLSRTTGYALAKQGLYPCRVLRLGRAYRVSTAHLLQILGIDAPRAVQAAEGAEPADDLKAA